MSRYRAELELLQLKAGIMGFVIGALLVGFIWQINFYYF